MTNRWAVQWKHWTKVLRSHPRWDRAGTHKSNKGLWHVIITYVLFISGIFHLISSEYGWLAGNWNQRQKRATAYQWSKYKRYLGDAIPASIIHYSTTSRAFLWIPVSAQYLYVESVCQGDGIWRELWGGDWTMRVVYSWMGISALVSSSWGTSSPSHHHREKQRREHYTAHKGLSPEPGHAGILILIFQAPALWETDVLVVSYLVDSISLQ